MRSKRELSREYSRIYKRSSRAGKSRILDEFIKLTDYNRCYASYILRNLGKKVYIGNGSDIRVVIVGDYVKRRYFRSRKKYDDKVLWYLVKYWEVLNFPCGKRLKSELFELILKSRQFKVFSVPNEIYKKLMSISAATIDRMLKAERKKYELKCRSKTKPGSILKKQISIRTGTDWQEDLSSDNGGIIAPPFDGSWPTARSLTLGAVTVTFVTGYGDDAEDVPESLIRAMMYRLADFYELRSSLDIAQPAFADELQDTAARVADEFVLRRFT